MVDIINKDDAVEDIDSEDKLGQPMVNLNLERDWGTLGFFVLPGFRERKFPDDDARLRGPLPIDDDNLQLTTGAWLWKLEAMSSHAEGLHLRVTRQVRTNGIAILKVRTWGTADENPRKRKFEFERQFLEVKRLFPCGPAIKPKSVESTVGGCRPPI